MYYFDYKVNGHVMHALLATLVMYILGILDKRPQAWFTYMPPQPTASPSVPDEH